MNIAILGYGKMGKTIEGIALGRGHRIVAKIDVENKEELYKLKKDEVDVAIEFSQPDAAFENIKTCISNGIKVISGTTGWLDKRPEIENLCRSMKGAFFYASNFSIGVNLFFKLNEYLAGLMTGYDQYKTGIREIHHTEKKDAPSGTAITIAGGIMRNNPRYAEWVNKKTTEDNVLGIESIREGEVPGTHKVNYQSDIDRIEIKHEAFGREGFALGAVLVAEWIQDKEGILTMDDFLEF